MTTMKKIMIVFSIMTGSIAAKAQHTDFGIKGGLNIADFSNYNGVDFNSRTSFHIGGLAHIHIARHFALQPELMYSDQGAKYSSVTYKNSYINIPVLAQFMVGSGFRLETGPQLGFLVSGKTENDNVTVDVKDSYKTTDFSWAFGASYLSSSRLGVDARYNLGLTDFTETNSSDIKNHVFQVGVFYQFR
jgi:opacity protein-like surface antigen